MEKIQLLFNWKIGINVANCNLAQKKLKVKERVTSKKKNRTSIPKRQNYLGRKGISKYFMDVDET